MVPASSLDTFLYQVFPAAEPAKIKQLTPLK